MQYNDSFLHINDAFLQYNTNLFFKNIKFPVVLTRVKVSELGVKSATTLKTIYNLLEKNNLKLVNPLVAINARFYYDEQPKGEWLRFGVPFNSMIDSNGIPHLPAHALVIFDVPIIFKSMLF